MQSPSLTRARALSWAIAGLMVAASAAGLLVDGLYRDEAWIRTAWLGNDVVTLTVAAPLLVISLVRAARGSTRGRLVWYALLAYCIYNYAYYLFGARMNAMFPIYVVLLVGPILALILALGAADIPATAAEFGARTPVHPVAAYMLLTGAGLLIAWLGQWANLVFGGVVPSIGEDAFKLVASLDLALVVPFFLLGAVLLWRRRPWGYVLAAIMNVKGATSTLVLAVSSAFAAHAGIEGAAAQIPIWSAWTALGALATVALLVGVRPAGSRG